MALNCVHPPLMNNHVHSAPQLEKEREQGRKKDHTITLQQPRKIYTCTASMA